ncbi:reverse transcriptase [Tanacetum coccineum]
MRVSNALWFNKCSIYISISDDRGVQGVLEEVYTAQGVATDPTKVQAMQSWPIPKNVKQLRGFLGLIGYYKRFIKYFATLTLVLGLPDFNKPFVVETDASGVVLLALEKWRGYLLDRHFVIKIDHYSLKYLLDQRITTPAQMKWLPKLMGFDYEVAYKKGKDNIIADALSRKAGDNEFLVLMSLPLLLNFMTRKGKLVVGNIKQLRQELLHYFHNGSNGVDRLTKYAHLIPLTHPFSAVRVARPFLNNVCKLHDHPKEWSKWLPLAELWYNSNYHSAIKTTHFEALYGQPPLVHVPYMGGMNRVDAVDRTLEAREKVVQLLKFHLERAQNRMKQQTNKHRSERVLEVGDWVWLKLQPHRQVSLRQEKQNKFSPKYFGPFEIISRVGEVAYKLKLSDHSQVHDVFHVSQLKRCKGNHQEAVLVPLPQLNQDGLIERQPMKPLDTKMVKRNNAMVIYRLIQWTNGDAQDATWELLEELCQRFPEFQLDS